MPFQVQQEWNPCLSRFNRSGTNAFPNAENVFCCTPLQVFSTTLQMLLPIATSFSVLVLVNLTAFFEMDNALLLIVKLIFWRSATFAIVMIFSLRLLPNVVPSLFGASIFTKIHKVNNPSRSIVSTCSCLTELISSYLDSVMLPIGKTLLTYIKDTNHTLRSLNKFRFQSNTKFLFTMDVKSLYTVIHNDEGLRALKYFFDRRTVLRSATTTLLHLAELVPLSIVFLLTGIILNRSMV